MGEKKRRTDAGNRPEIIYVAREDTRGGRSLPPGPCDTLVVQIAVKGQTDLNIAREAADWTLMAAHHKPGAVLSVTVGGWDSDPREVLDIPEAMAMFKAYAERLEVIDTAASPEIPYILNRLDSFSRHLLMIALGYASRDRVRITPMDDPSHMEQYLADLERIKATEELHRAETEAAAKSSPKQ